MYLHRRGSDVVNGRYFHDDDPTGTVAHHSSFRAIDVDRLGTRLASIGMRPRAVSPRTGGRCVLPATSRSRRSVCSTSSARTGSARPPSRRRPIRFWPGWARNDVFVRNMGVLIRQLSV